MGFETKDAMELHRFRRFMISSVNCTFHVILEPTWLEMGKDDVA